MKQYARIIRSAFNFSFGISGQEFNYIYNSDLFDSEFVEQAYGLNVSRRTQVIKYLRGELGQLAQTSPYFDGRHYSSQLSSPVTNSTLLYHFLREGANFNLDPTYLFDVDFYKSQCPQALGPLDPVTHYLRVGRFSGLMPHPLFDPTWYLAQNEDVAISGADALGHFLNYGAKEGRNPHYLFDLNWYSAQTGISLDESFKDFIDPTSNFKDPHPLFDVEWYLKSNPDVQRSSINPLIHYTFSGWSELRKPHPLFDPTHYLSQARSKGLTLQIDPLRHYLAVGDKAGLSPHMLFDPNFYRARNPDVAQGEQPTLVHFVMYGGREGRDPHPLFNTSWYMASNDDVNPDRWIGLDHFVLYGSKEGRSFHPGFDSEWYSTFRGIAASDQLQLIDDFVVSGLKLKVPPGPGTESLHLVGNLDHVFDDPRLATSKPASKGSCLFVSHRFGGGTALHVDSLRAHLEMIGIEVITLTFLGRDEISLHSFYNGKNNLIKNFTSQDEALTCLREFSFAFIHYHQVMTGPYELIYIARELSLPYFVTIHDYFYICPRVNLIDVSGRYCGQPSAEQCDRCISIGGTYPGLERDFIESRSTAAWRQRYARWLEGARAVIVPSQDTAMRISSYTQANLLVRPHPETGPEVKLRPPPAGSRLRIGLIGAIGPHKGADLLLDCARDAHLRNLALDYVVIGEISGADRFENLPNVTITGRYPQPLLNLAVDAEPIHAALFLSVWPETYCYALSEVVSLGIFPISLDIGAVGERVRQMKWGSLIKFDSTPSEINDHLLELGTYRSLPPHGLRIYSRYSNLLGDYYGLGRI